MFITARIHDDDNFSFSCLRMKPISFRYGMKFHVIHKSLNIFFLKKEDIHEEYSCYGIENEEFSVFEKHKFLEKMKLNYFSKIRDAIDKPIFETFEEAEFARKLIISKNIYNLKKEEEKIEILLKRINEGKINFSLDKFNYGKLGLTGSVVTTGFSEDIPDDVKIFFQEKLSEKYTMEMDKCRKNLKYYENFKPTKHDSTSTES